MTKEGKEKLKRVLKVLVFVIVFLLLIWIVLRPFRHEWSKYFVEKAKTETQTSTKVALLYRAKFLTPLSYSPYFELGKIDFQNENYQKAEKYFSWALRFCKSDIQVYFWFTSALINEEKIDQAKGILEKAEITDPNNPEIKFLKTRIELAQNNWFKALTEITPVKNREEKYETYWLLIMIERQKSVKIEEVRFSVNKSFLAEFLGSENSVYKNALVADQWIKLGEKKIGCSQAKQVKNKNPTIWSKLKTWQQEFSQCNL